MEQRPFLLYMQWASNAALIAVGFGIWIRVARGHMLWQDLLIFVAGLVMLSYGVFLVSNWRDEANQYITYVNTRARRSGQHPPLSHGNVRFNGSFAIVSGAIFSLGAITSMAAL